MYDFNAVVSKSEYLILALGRGYQVDEQGQPVSICSAGRERADLAIDIAQTLEKFGYKVTLCATAGREKSRRDGPTMAELTAQYWHRLAPSLSLLVNCDELKVWGTLGELEWIGEYLEREGKLATTIVVAVAAPRQDSRVKRMQTWFKLLPGLKLDVVRTTENPIPHYHEFLGYCKLALIACGLRPAADWFRQTTARPIKQSSNNN